MNPKDRKIALMRSIAWSFLVILAMAVSFNFALVVTGETNWISPSVALFTVLGTLVLVATQVSLMLGGGRTKAERIAAREQ